MPGAWPQVPIATWQVTQARFMLLLFSTESLAIRARFLAPWGTRHAYHLLQTMIVHSLAEGG